MPAAEDRRLGQGLRDATDGTPRTLHAWRDRAFNAYMGVGTYKKLYVYDQGLAQNDITPYRATGTLGANPLTTAVGSNVITVAPPRMAFPKAT
jgi:hypothetical protein